MATEIYGSLGVVGTVDEVEIHATNDGKFAAIVGGAVIRLANKKALEKRITGAVAPVELMYTRYLSSAPEIRTAVGITRGKYDIRVRWLRPNAYNDGAQEITDRSDDFYHYHAEIFDELTANAAAIGQLMARRTELLSIAGKVTAKSWAEAQNEAQALKAEQES